MINIDSLFNTQKENEIGRIFSELMSQIDIEDNSLKIFAKDLMQKYDNDLYDVLKNYSSFRILSKTKQDLIKLLKNHPNINNSSYI